jgi:hypothetical protein
MNAYPYAPGHRGVETSIAAAEAVAPKLERLQKMALEAIKSRGPCGLTANELAEALGLDRYSIQPRTSELRRKMLIADGGVRRRNASGKRAIVFTLPRFVRELGDEEATNLLTAAHPKQGTIWAAVDPSVHHIEGAVRDSRFGARLAPFKSRADAEAALVAAGGKLDGMPA